MFKKEDILDSPFWRNFLKCGILLQNVLKYPVLKMSIFKIAVQHYLQTSEMNNEGSSVYTQYSDKIKYNSTTNAKYMQIMYHYP